MNEDKALLLLEDPRFVKALDLFNSAEWYQAHDVFEEVWHETNGPERKLVQGFLQVAVAQLHLQRGNKVGATILYGEALGRLRSIGTPDLGLHIEYLCRCVEARLKLLQKDRDPESCEVPVILQRHLEK